MLVQATRVDRDAAKLRDWWAGVVGLSFPARRPPSQRLRLPPGRPRQCLLLRRQHQPRSLRRERTPRSLRHRQATAAISRTRAPRSKETSPVGRTKGPVSRTRRQLAPQKLPPVAHPTLPAIPPLLLAAPPPRPAQHRRPQSSRLREIHRSRWTAQHLPHLNSSKADHRYPARAVVPRWPAITPALSPGLRLCTRPARANPAASCRPSDLCSYVSRMGRSTRSGNAPTTGGHGWGTANSACGSPLCSLPVRATTRPSRGYQFAAVRQLLLRNRLLRRLRPLRRPTRSTLRATRSIRFFLRRPPVRMRQQQPKNTRPSRVTILRQSRCQRLLAVHLRGPGRPHN